MSFFWFRWSRSLWSHSVTLAPFHPLPVIQSSRVPLRSYGFSLSFSFIPIHSISKEMIRSRRLKPQASNATEIATSSVRLQPSPSFDGATIRKLPLHTLVVAQHFNVDINLVCHSRSEKGRHAEVLVSYCPELRLQVKPKTPLLFPTSFQILSSALLLFLPFILSSTQN